MQQKKQNNFFNELKLSITGILTEIGNSTAKGKVILENLTSQQKTEDYSGESLTTFMTVAIQEFNNPQNTINTNLSNISKQLTIISENIISKTNETLLQIKDILSNTHKSILDVVTKNNKIKLEITGDDLSNLSKTISDKFVKNFNQFVASMEKFANIDTAKIEKITESLVKLRESRNNGGSKMSPMMQIGIGIAVITASLIGLAFVDFASIFKLVTFIGLLSISLKLFKDSQNDGISLISFSVGIGILTLSLIAMKAVEWTSIFKLILFIGLLGLTMKMFNFHKGGNKSPMIAFASGIGIMVLAMVAMSYIPWESVFKFTIFVAILGLAMRTFPGKTPGWEMAKFATGLGLMVLSMFAMQELPLLAMFTTLGFLFGLGLVLKLFNKQAAVSMLIMSGGLLLMAGAFTIISALPLSIEKALIFGGSIVLFAGIMALLGIPAVAPLILLGAATVAAMAVASILTAVSFSIISAMKIDHEAINTFVMGAKLLAVSMMEILPYALLGVLGAVALIPITVATLLTATTLALISAIKIDEGNIENYNNGVKMIIDNINEFGLIQLGKASAKAILMIPMFGSVLAGAIVLKAISELNVSESKIEAFGGLMNSFVTSMTETISTNIDALKKVEPGLDALSKLINVGSNLADIVSAFANMTYNVYEVKDGKLVLSSVKKITPEEIGMVGVNIGKLIQGLLKPLAIISGDEDTWDFGGGVKVKNPFAGGWFGDKDSGIERLTKIGNAFIPLTEVMKNLSTMKVDDKGANIAIQSLVGVINEFEKLSEKDLNLNDVSNPMTEFLNSMSDVDQWNTINENLDKMAKSYKSIVTNINKLNIDKALALEKNLKLLAAKETNKGIDELIEKLVEMIGLLNEKSSGSLIGNKSQTSSTVNNKTVIQNNTEAISSMSDDVVTILKSIADKVGLTNTKLSGRLKTIIIEQNKNSI